MKKGSSRGFRRTKDLRSAYYMGTQKSATRLTWSYSFSLVTKIQQPPCLLPGGIKNYAITLSLKNRRSRSSAIFLIQEFIPTDLSCNREKTNNDVPAIGLIAINVIFYSPSQTRPTKKCV